jgi:hypothetical protein
VAGAAGAAKNHIDQPGSTTSTTYGPLNGAFPTGPSVTLTIPGTQALVLLTAAVASNNAVGGGLMSVSVDGAPASDQDSLRVFGLAAFRATAATLITGLTPGSHTFTAVYKVNPPGPGTATFVARDITVVPG